MKFLHNYIAIYGASFKAQNICQIFCFWSKFVLLSQLSRQQIQLSKIWLSHFLVNMTKYPHAKNIHYVDPDKNVSDRQTDRQADRQTDGMINRTDFIDPLGKD